MFFLFLLFAFYVMAPVQVVEDPIGPLTIVQDNIKNFFSDQERIHLYKGFTSLKDYIDKIKQNGKDFRGKGLSVKEVIEAQDFENEIIIRCYASELLGSYWYISAIPHNGYFELVLSYCSIWNVGEKKEVKMRPDWFFAMLEFKKLSGIKDLTKYAIQPCRSIQDKGVVRFESIVKDENLGKKAFTIAAEKISENMPNEFMRKDVVISNLFKDFDYHEPGKTDEEIWLKKLEIIRAQKSVQHPKK